MNQFLVLRISNPYSWVITGADGGRLGPVATGDLADCRADREGAAGRRRRARLERDARPAGTAREVRREARAGRALRDGGIARRRGREVPLRHRRDRRGRQHAGRGHAARGTAQLARRAQVAGIEPHVRRAGHALPPGEPGQDRRGDRLRACCSCACRGRCRSRSTRSPSPSRSRSPASRARTATSSSTSRSTTGSTRAR